MYFDMEWWKEIRLEVLRGETSKREILRQEGIHWKTLQKILSYSEPPGYQMSTGRPKPKIGSYLGRIEEIIKKDKAIQKKQRHTAKRIYVDFFMPESMSEPFPKIVLNVHLLLLF